MTKINEVYKCNICGNIVEVVHSGVGELVCCGAPMQLKEENVEEAATEKHIPVVEATENGVKVTVGEVLHPMTEEHHIEWIEIIADGRVYRKNLKAGDEPVAEFCVKAEEMTARAYCNLHGLWKK